MKSIINISAFLIGLLLSAPALVYSAEPSSCGTVTGTGVTAALQYFNGSFSGMTQGEIESSIEGAAAAVGYVQTAGSAGPYGTWPSNCTVYGGERVIASYGTGGYCLFDSSPSLKIQHWHGSYRQWNRTIDGHTDPNWTPENITYCPVTYAEPATCFDEILTAGEDGVDCGGVCSATCKNECPPGTDYLLEVGGIGTCIKYSMHDSFNNCPDGYVFETDGTDTWCEQRIDASLVRDEVTYVYPETSPDFNGTFTPLQSNTSSLTTNSTVDNGDGTSTETIETVTTNPDNTTSTTTVTRIVDNTSGQPISETVDTQEQSSDNPDNYNFDLADGEFDATIAPEDMPEEESLTGLWQTTLFDHPVISMFENSGIEVADEVCSMTWDYKGTPVVFSFCGEPYTSTFTMMGNFLIFLSTISGYFIIFGRGD